MKGEAKVGDLQSIPAQLVVLPLVLRSLNLSGDHVLLVSGVVVFRGVVTLRGVQQAKDQLREQPEETKGKGRRTCSAFSCSNNEFCLERVTPA